MAVLYNSVAQPRYWGNALNKTKKINKRERVCSTKLTHMKTDKIRELEYFILFSNQ